MPGSPDFLKTLSQQSELLQSFNAVLIGAAAQTVGPFGIGGFRALLLAQEVSSGDIDTVVTVEVDGTARPPQQTWTTSIRAGNAGLFVLPIYGAEIATIVITGDNALTNLSQWVLGTNHFPYAHDISTDGILYAELATAVANAATWNVFLPPFWGDAIVALNLPGASWNVTVSAEDRAGTVVGNIYSNAAFTGFDRLSLRFPPRIIHLAAVNNTGAGQNASITVLTNPYSL